MGPVKVASKSLYETSAVAVFPCLLTPTLLGVCNIAVTFTVTCTLPCWFSVFPHSFGGKERLVAVCCCIWAKANIHLFFDQSEQDRSHKWASRWDYILDSMPHTKIQWIRWELSLTHNFHLQARIYYSSKMVQLAALVKSNMNDLISLKRTMEQTTEILQKSKHFNRKVNEWKATQPSLRVFSGKLSKMGALQKLQNSIQTLIILSPVYPIHTNSLFWVTLEELPFCHFPPPKYFCSWLRLSNLVDLSFEYLSFQTNGKQSYSFPVLSHFCNGL